MQDEVLKYMLNQKVKVHQSENVINKKYITHYNDLYPELTNLNNIAYIRGETDLKTIALLYDRVVVFIPPVSEQHIISQYNITYNELIMLCKEGIVIPLIGDPLDYDYNTYKELFSLEPISVLSRGLAVLDKIGMENYIEKAAVDLPMDKIVRAELKRRNITTRNRKELGFEKDKIIKDYSILYADLCAFGYGEEIDSIIKDNKSCNIDNITNSMKCLNEIFTYPTIFGLNGTAVFDKDKIRRMAVDLSSEMIAPKSTNLPKEFFDLNTRFGIDTSKISILDIIFFRQSKGNKVLSKAVEEFDMQLNEGYSKNAINPDNVLANYVAIEDNIKKCLSDMDYKKAIVNIDKLEKRFENYFRFGGMAIGALIGSSFGEPIWSIMTGAIGVSVESIFGHIDIYRNIKERIIEKAIKQEFHPTVAHLWSSKKIIEKRNRG